MKWEQIIVRPGPTGWRRVSEMLRFRYVREAKRTEIMGVGRGEIDQ